MYTRRMIQSVDEIDNRIVDIYRIRKANELSLKLADSSRWKNLSAHKMLLPMIKSDALASSDY